MNSLKKISLIFSLFLITACAESLSFSQLEDYSLEPVFSASLIHFKVVPSQFFDSAGMIQQNTVSDEADFKIFENQFIRDNVIQIDLNFQIKNEFDRDVTLNLGFYNINGILIYNVTPLVIEAKSQGFSHLEQIKIDENPNFLMATQFRLTATLEDTGVQLNLNDPSAFELQSSVSVYIKSAL